MANTSGHAKTPEAEAARRAKIAAARRGKRHSRQTRVRISDSLYMSYAERTSTEALLHRAASRHREVI